MFYIDRIFLSGSILLSCTLSPGQDLDQILNDAANSKTDYTAATFKSTHIVTCQSIERMQAGQLDVRFSHHFGQLNTGPYDLWGLDQAFIHFGLDYGITNWMMVGIGRGTYQKTYDEFLKFSILRQSKGAANMPISLSFFVSSAINSLDDADMGVPKFYFWDRFSYVYQVLIARKFNENLSLELNPTLVHRNMVGTELDPNDILSLGMGGRFKLSKRVSLNIEYYYLVPPFRNDPSIKIYPPLSIGFDIETGGHVFQLFLTNSDAMIESAYITNTTYNWRKGAIYFGFNISRVFALK